MAGEIDKSYLTSVFGILKIIEFVCLVVGWACLIDFYGQAFNLHSRDSFFLAVNITAWVFVIVWFLCYLFYVCGKVTLSNKMLIYAFIHFMWFVLLLISGALVADRAASFTKFSCYYFKCELYDMAAAFGIISSFVFLIDGIYHIQQRNSISSSGSGRKVVTKRTVVTTTTTKSKR